MLRYFVLCDILNKSKFSITYHIFLISFTDIEMFHVCFFRKILAFIHIFSRSYTKRRLLTIKQAVIRKNIGRIFRKYNIVEYKSPTDYLSIDDFYKVYAYACFYKTDTHGVDGIKAEDITLTFVCTNTPKKLLNHLVKIRKYRIELFEKGIYYICGDFFPIQLIITSELSKKNNFWLRNLTNRITKQEDVEELVIEYQKHRGDKLYQAVMDTIVRANEKSFEEEKNMCEAIIDLFRDEYDEGIRKTVEQSIKAMVEVCKSLGVEKEQLASILQDKFHIEEKKARDYIEMYW